MQDQAVLSAVSKAFEVLSSTGARALDYSRQRGGWSDLTGADAEAARAILEAVTGLPAEHNLALMWRVTRDNPRYGEGFLLDLTCFVAHHIADGERFGREGLMYWVRHWARHDGSSREAAFLFGRSRDAHQRFYREHVRLCLDGWWVAAKGAIEPVIERYYCDYREAA